MEYKSDAINETVMKKWTQLDRRFWKNNGWKITIKEGSTRSKIKKKGTKCLKMVKWKFCYKFDQRSGTKFDRDNPIFFATKGVKFDPNGIWKCQKGGPSRGRFLPPSSMGVPPPLHTYSCCESKIGTYLSYLHSFMKPLSNGIWYSIVNPFICCSILNMNTRIFSLNKICRSLNIAWQKSNNHYRYAMRSFSTHRCLVRWLVHMWYLYSLQAMTHTYVWLLFTIAYKGMLWQILCYFQSISWNMSESCM